MHMMTCQVLVLGQNTRGVTVPTNNHILFDDTQIILGPLKLGATYLDIVLV